MASQNHIHCWPAALYCSITATHNHILVVHAMEGLHTSLSKGGTVVAWKDFQTTLSLQQSSKSSRQCSVSLENEDLWDKFHSITNEMIVTRAGRRTFPSLQVHLSSLDPSHMYSVLLEFQPTHTHRWRFLNGEWQASSSIADPPEQQPGLYVHPSSPASGLQWMKDPVSFAKLKLSNKENGNGKVKLNSLQRYQPCIHIVRLASLLEDQSDITSHQFKATQFIAVTAYQNEKITQMKIKHNPFAKAFLSSHESKDDVRPALPSFTDALPPSLPTTHLTPPTLTHASTGQYLYPGGVSSPLAAAPLSHYSIPPYYHYHPYPVASEHVQFRTTNYSPNLAHGQPLTHNPI